MLVTESRPRNLKWYHAGPLLFGDWGTSRLYVLGLAFFFTAHASVYYLIGMSLVMAAVAWAYTVICRCFPDGGGVYSSARQISPLLSVIGATLLLCDYIVTASLSTIEAFHYFGVPESWVVVLSIATIGVLGMVNWFGARNAGRFALGIALAAMVASLVVAMLCFPFIRKGLGTVNLEGIANASNWERWQSLVRIMLALSGVEAVSNMTGLMTPPVDKTARKTIWPVLVEVIVLNLVFGVALAGLPKLAAQHRSDYETYIVDRAAGVSEEKAADAVPDEVTQYRDTAMKVLAMESGKHAFGDSAGLLVGRAAALIFGLLLLSATNTVIVDKISVTYTMGRDRELPHGFTKLNYSGVPWWGVLFACIAPCAVLLFVSDVMLLADLYAVGVVGAICINVLCCAYNRKIDVRGWERGGLLVVGLLMLAVEVTIVATKPHAAYFAGGMVAIVLAGRWIIHSRRPKVYEAVPRPAEGWLAELRRSEDKIKSAGPRIMLAARGRDQAEFAVDLARRRGAALFAMYVRAVKIMDYGTGSVASIEDDPEAQESLGTIAVLARKAGVPFLPIYIVSPLVAEEILDYTATFGCDTIVMGKSKRGFLARTIGEDVMAKVAQSLPEGVSLVARASRAPLQSLIASEAVSAATSSASKSEEDHPPPS